MREIKLRHTFKRKRDGHIYQVIWSVSPEGCDMLMSMKNNELWEEIGREQYTGLKDKNGVEIYEGDVVLINWLDRRYENVIETVTWCEQSACFEFGAGATSEVSWSHEVIGNVHENPELLGQKSA